VQTRKGFANAAAKSAALAIEQLPPPGSSIALQKPEELCGVVQPPRLLRSFDESGRSGQEEELEAVELSRQLFRRNAQFVVVLKCAISTCWKQRRRCLVLVLMLQPWKISESSLARSTVPLSSAWLEFQRHTTNFEEIKRWSSMNIATSVSKWV
jgi:hypothetical protein